MKITTRKIADGVYTVSVDGTFAGRVTRVSTVGWKGHVWHAAEDTPAMDTRKAAAEAVAARYAEVSA